MSVKFHLFSCKFCRIVWLFKLCNLSFKSCNFHIRVLRHICRHISDDAAKTIACSMANGRLENCYSLLHSTSSFNINKLLQIQSCVVRIITRRRLSDHITPVLADLHCSVQYRTQYKLAVMTFKVLTTQELSYLHDLTPRPC